MSTKQISYAQIEKDNEELIDRVAQSEQTLEQKEQELNVMTKKKMDYKFVVESLKDKNKSMEEVLDKSEQNKQDEVKQMEARIESRVAKIIL